MFLLMLGITVILLDRIDMVIRERSDLGNTKDPSEFLEHIMIFYQGKDEEVADGFSNNPSTRHKGCIPKIYMNKFVLGKARMLSMITQIIEGQGLYFSS